MLASDLIPLLEKMGEVIEGDLPHFDITDIDCIISNLNEVKPDMVVNCAAYTAVDRAEEERDLAFKVNGMGAENLAIACKEINSRLIHVSTDFVFDGESNRPYSEDDAANPLSAYGKSKLEGEIRVRETTDDYVIVRTSWLYGRHGNNFVKTVKKLAEEREDLGIVYDQVGTPTYTGDLAEGIANLMKAEPGIYHFSNEGVCSWFDFAYEIVQMLKERGDSLRLKRLRPILTEEYPSPAQRPRYSVLNKSRYKGTTGTDIPHWRDGLKRYFESVEC